jgi:hypothetical protein
VIFLAGDIWGPWGFLKWKYPKMHGLQWKILSNWWFGGTPYFRKPPYIYIYTYVYYIYSDIYSNNKQ